MLGDAEVQVPVAGRAEVRAREQSGIAVETGSPCPPSGGVLLAGGRHVRGAAAGGRGKGVNALHVRYVGQAWVTFCG